MSEAGLFPDRTETLAALPYDTGVLDALLADFDATAAERDQAGGTAKRERDLIRQSGLLALSIPEDLGGLGGSLTDALRVTRRLATVDSALAHLFAFHHFQLATLRFYAPRRQWAPLYEQTAANRWFWGNALNPLDKTTRITPGPNPDEHRIDGIKTFCSGATDSDMLVVSAIRDGVPGLTVAAIPTGREGVAILGDWDNMGQRQTDSGRVSFTGVPVHDGEILREPGPLGSPFAALRSCLGQLILTEIYAGLAEGALTHAIAHLDPSAPAWIAAKVATVAEDKLVLRTLGDSWVAVAGAAALTDQAERRFQDAFDLGDAITPQQRGETAMAIASAKVASTRAALEVTSRIFEVLGARATNARLRLDRFWRNARTHTLHDPVDQKLVELGAWRLTGEHPAPSFYS